MKKSICLLMVLTLLLASAGCSRRTPPPAGTIPEETETAVSTEPVPETEASVPVTEETRPTETELPESGESTETGAETEESTEPEHQHRCTSKVTRAPTCTASGVITYTCQDCGASWQKNLEPLNHSFVITKKAPDCTSSGGTTYLCKDCGYLYTDAFQPALGHSYGPLVTVKNPTELLPGRAEHTCIRCGAVESIELPRLAP